MSAAYLATHNDQTDTIPCRMSWLAVAVPIFGRGGTDEIAISDQRGGHISRPVGKKEWLRGSGRSSQQPGVGMIPGGQFIYRACDNRLRIPTFGLRVC